MSPSDSVGERCSGKKREDNTKIKKINSAEAAVLSFDSFCTTKLRACFVKQFLLNEMGRTGSKYLREDAFLVGAVNVVWRLSSFVGTVEQAAIFRVPQQQLSQLTASPSDGNVEGRVSFLSEEEKVMFISPN